MEHLKIKLDTIDQLFSGLALFEKADRFETNLSLPFIVLDKNWIKGDLLVCEIMQSKINAKKGWVFSKTVDYIYILGEKILLDRKETEKLIVEKLKKKEWAKSPEENKMMITGDKVVGFIKLEELKNLV